MKESSAWALKLLIPPQEMYVESDEFWLVLACAAANKNNSNKYKYL